MRKEPLVVCLTNTVAANFTANCLLAIGAKPAMIEDADEAAELTAVADALLVNVGTLTREQAAVMKTAVSVATEKSVPWVLDPVACHCLEFRRKFVLNLLDCHPSLVRGNLVEIGYLREFHASSLGSVPVLATGRQDVVSCGGEIVATISGGVELLQRVTATGCAQGAVCAAFLGWGQTPENACISASKLMKSAGERAIVRAPSPGSFQTALLDALSELAGDSHD